MQFVIVTGMSGAGKSTLLSIFEDIGYYCVDNLPPRLLQNLADFCLEGGSGIDKVALGIDIRGTKLFNDLFDSLRALEARQISYQIVFLDSSDDVLLTRFKETRRSHPLDNKESSRADVITAERELLASVKQHATHIIDTSMLLVRQLREKIIEFFIESKDFGIIVHVQSFGFKYGAPVLADLVFDVRCLPNPFYVQDLKDKTGLDESVRNFVMEGEVSKRFLHDVSELLLFLLPHYIKEGKHQLVVALGCTGGKHRSVTIARGIHDVLRAAGHSLVIDHRDITKT